METIKRIKLTFQIYKNGNGCFLYVYSTLQCREIRRKQNLVFIQTAAEIASLGCLADWLRYCVILSRSLCARESFFYLCWPGKQVLYLHTTIDVNFA